MKIVIILILCLLLYPQTVFANSIHFGTTFSPIQCEYLDLDWEKTYLRILDLPLDFIRLGAYWNHIEKNQGEFDFQRLDWMIEKAKERDVSVVLVVGIKSPRWPEYHLPQWITDSLWLRQGQVITQNEDLRKHALAFIEKIVNHYKDDPIISHWQVENEALNRFGINNWRMDKDFLSKEVAKVRELDHLDRPVVLTASTFPNQFLRILSKIFTRGKPLRDNLKFADILGVNVYPVIGQKMFGRPWYYKTRKSSRLKYFKKIHDIAQKQQTELWVTELQAEPWEPGHLAYKEETTPPSGWPSTTREILKELHGLGYRVFFFWGAEYWYYQKETFNNSEWWDMVEELIVRYKTSNYSN